MANLNSERQINSDNDDDGSSEDEGTYIDGIYIPPPIKPACSLECKGPRLIITHINNNFFKSYAQNVTLGPFHKCFNSIIGPNGSGKSNVIDSMLFVFGFRANEIRSKKLSVLIHNSEKYKNVESATVSVHFAQIIDKEGDDYEIVPNSRFYVSRTVMKDNSSFYYLNDRKVKYKEIKTLLSGHGIDLDHKRFLILQGEVEQIASMKCKGESPNETGILEYLEDIVGTSRYIKPLQQLHERVETLDDAKSEKVNRLRLVQSELEKLKEPMEEAVEYLKTENSLAHSKNIIYQKNIFELEKKSKLVEEDKSLIEANKQELEAKIHELTEKRKEKERKWEEESGKHNSLTKRKATLKEAFDKANNKDVELQAEMVQVNKNRKKTIQLLAEERKKLETLEKTPQESEKGIEECLKREKTITAQKEKLETEKVKLLENIKTETQPLQEKKEELENKLMPLNKKVNETKAAYDLAESELKICQSNEENEKNKYENLKSTYENSESLLKERKEQVVSLKNKIPLTQRSLTEAINELKTIKQEQTEIRQTVNTKRASLEEVRSSMQASKSRSKVLDSLMQQKQDGKCPGLFGRLGDLGAIDQKYDVAISTACGPLDNIVVDTVSTAQWCIEFLKEYDIGRATFIALEKQEHLRDYANTRIQTPENVPRLFDLIKVQDDRVKTAFYYALRDTLVVSELEQASRIAYGAERYRVVTLNGDLIETTGTMSGGGRTASRGRMGQSVKVTTNVKDIEKYEKELENAEVRFQELRNREIQLDKQIEILEPELRKMKIDYEKYSIELKTLTEQQPMILKQLKTQEQKAKSTKSDAVQVKKLTDQVLTNKAAYDKAVEIAQKLQVEVDELTKEIKAKTIGRMKKMDKDINDAVKSIEKLQSEITRLKVSVKTAERNAQKSTEKIKGMEQDIINSEQRLRDMNSQRSEIETDGEKLLKCIEEIENELKNGESGYAEMKEEVDQLKKMLNKLKSEEVDVNQRLKTITGKINEINSTMHQWNVKISQLKLQDIPDTAVEELKTYTEEELDEKDIETVEKNLKFAENKLKSIKPNLSVLQEYRKKQEIYLVRAKELDEISEKRREMKGLYDKLREQRKEEFSKGFEIIRLKLKEMYQMITLGGDADFEYVDTFDAFTEGIQFIVRPPKKSWKRIENLSGGERTLSSLALVFALHYYKPSPLYVMDEIDAALDFKNVSIVGHYIKERTKNAQFIIISLRSQMFELGDTLVGIYKTYNTTKTIAISPKDFDKTSNSNTRLPTNQDNEKTNDENNDFNSEKQNEDSNIGLNSDIQNNDTNLEEQNDDTNMENHNGTSVSDHQNISSDTSSYKTAEERIIADSFEEMDVD